MEDILVRIARALEEQNTITRAWIDLQSEWHKEDTARVERGITLNNDWIEWNKQQKTEELERSERWHDADLEKSLLPVKEYHEKLFDLQRDIILRFIDTDDIRTSPHLLRMKPSPKVEIRLQTDTNVED